MAERNVEFYLSKGFDRPMANYFAAGRRKITGVTPNDNFTLTLLFDNGEVRLYDVAPLLRKGTVFEPLSDPDRFRRVYLDEQNCVAWDIDPTVDSNLVWDNKVDLSPDTCYVDSNPIPQKLD